MEQQLTQEDITRFSEAFDADPKNLLALNAVTQNPVGTIALNRRVVSQATHVFSNVIETPEATSQESSGRCWMFAGLNTFRLKAMEKMNLEKFELSQTYLMFWDKLEKANFFLENIIETRNEALNSRLVMWLLSDPMPDGGQWDMFVSLVRKYGVIPKSAMPETNSSSASGSMNAVLVAKCREYACTLREMHENGASPDELRGMKSELMAEFYKILTIHLGKPPRTVFWEWRDKDKKFNRDGTMTPGEFFKKYVDTDLDEMVCLIHSPTTDKPLNTLFTVRYLGNIVGGQEVRYLNVDIEVIRRAAAEMILENQPVWFGCDVGKMLEREKGIMDAEAYDYGLVYGTTFKLDKARRLDYGHSRMTHAMVMTGVDLDEEKKPVKWRVENSWGTKIGDKGYMVMSDGWFDEYLYEITVSRKKLSPELLKILETEPVVVLPPWDPMGALAKSA
ncbi:MAG: aminopeptidase [Desulfobacteraceae bacterium 4572_88]|nr:MAG: aminopeptidase [Desulfobacteraceae bacterium 4572_88]